ncbi:DUF4304 domain-containing protein [Streptosporangium sp. NPDC006007]|uniref:DUF4304 domain-containing protein n=1 Tax=Streptosporangium sp. NPDC006007 TaxID=3154575 RepID=UPI0033BA770F
MINRVALANVFNETLRPLNFRRRGDNWYRRGEEIYAIVNIQRSRWDDLCYINIGFSLVDRLYGDWIPEPKCLVRFRVEALNCVSCDTLSLLDEEKPIRMSEAERHSAIAAGIGVPVARTVGDIVDFAGLKRLLKSDMLDGGVFVHREISEMLD